MDFADRLLIEALVHERGAIAVKAAVDEAVKELADRDERFPDWELTGEV